MALKNLVGAFAALILVATVARAAPIDILASSNGGVADINGVSGPGSGGFGAVAASFNDQNPDGNFGDGSVAHSTNGMVGNYMEVTIWRLAPMNEVVLYNRTDCCGTRIDGGGTVPYTLTIYDGAPGPSTIAFSENLTFVPTITGTNLSGQVIKLPQLVFGDVVRITQNNNDYENLAELEAFYVPEPSPLVALVGMAGLGAVVLIRRKRRS